MAFQRAKVREPVGEAGLFEYAVGMLARRMRTVRDLRRLMKTRAFPGAEGEAAIDAVVARLIELNYLSDTRFAADYTRLRKEGEKFGRRFGEEDIDAGVTEASRAQRHAQVECARRLTMAIAGSGESPGELRARAFYLEGNLAFLDAEYEDAVKAYDQALVLAPGEVDAGDPVGRDAAYNRAIALQRIEDSRKDAGSDASRDGGDGPHQT